MSLALTAFAAAIKPPSESSNIEWIEENVILPHSIKSPQVDYDLTPYFREPMLRLADDETRECTVMGPTGSGKTSGFMEPAAAWIVAENPANSAIVFHTQTAINKWRKARLLPTLKATKATSDLVPPDRSPKNKKEYIQFNNMMLQTIFASESQLQSDTIKIMLGDEVWKWDPAMLEELRRRNHGQFDYKLFLVSQGGIENDQLDTAFGNGEIFDWCMCCPDCGNYQPMRWKQVKWRDVDPKTGEKENLKTPGGEWDWKKIESRCRYECATEGCDHVWRDTPVDRRRMNDGAKYISRNNNHLPNRVSYHYNVLAVSWVIFFELVQQWLTANDALKKHDKKPLRQFIQKRLAESYVEKIETPKLEGASDDPYKKKDYYNGEKWEFENFRFLTIDKGQDNYWAVCRAWSVDGKSRLLWEGELHTWDAARELQERMEVPNRWVFVDGSYKPEEVAHACHAAITEKDRQPWNMIKGKDCEGFTVVKGRGKQAKKITSMYSGYKRGRTARGLEYKYVLISSLLGKDLLASLMAAKDKSWQIPIDHSDNYKKHMENETKQEVSPNKWMWKKSKEWIRNDLWDCEYYQCYAASLVGVFGYD